MKEHRLLVLVFKWRITFPQGLFLIQLLVSSYPYKDNICSSLHWNLTQFSEHTIVFQVSVPLHIIFLLTTAPPHTTKLQEKYMKQTLTSHNTRIKERKKMKQVRLEVKKILNIFRTLQCKICEPSLYFYINSHILSIKKCLKTPHTELMKYSLLSQVT